jgi:hypothetical protein
MGGPVGTSRERLARVSAALRSLHRNRPVRDRGVLPYGKELHVSRTNACVPPAET